MATRITTEIAQLLKDKRAGADKAPIYRTLGVSPQTYDGWESGFRIPDDSYIPRLAEHLGVPEIDLAVMAYRERINRAKGALLVLGLHSNPPVLVAA